MARWTTVTFVQAFLRNKLGRKRIHGSYRVLDGAHCKVLVRATTSYGRPSGNEVIAINLDSETERVAFLHSFNTRCFTYHMNNTLDTYHAPKLPSSMLNDGHSNLLASGIIDTNDNEILIEIGDKPYLLYKRKKDDGPVVTWFDGVCTFNSADPVSIRVATINEAKELLADPPGAEQLCGLWWAHKQPSGFQPPKLDDSVLKILSNPVNPLNHGYLISDCFIKSEGVYSDATQTLIPDTALLQEPLDSRSRSYLTARCLWNDTCKVVKKRLPMEYEGLTIKKDKYATSSTPDEKTGCIIRTSSGVFIQGLIKNNKDWGLQSKLDHWYKLDSKINRIDLT